jgi:2-hydroxychromene-2-carboxylate isomerase
VTKEIDYYFSLQSPWTYLGAGRFAEIVCLHGAVAHVKPCDFGRVFAASGGLPLPQRPKQRQAYRLVELERWRDFLGIPLILHPTHLPLSGDLGTRAVVAARRLRGEDGALALAAALGRAIWAEDRDIADPATVEAVTSEAGLDGGAILSAAVMPEIAAEYAANTDEAIERQVFGAPTYVFRGELFWGQDRLDFLERALARS